MRTNSTGLRLGYSSSWKNRFLVGREYSKKFMQSKVIAKLLLNFFTNKNIKRKLIIGNVFIKHKNENNIFINIFVYMPFYKKITDFLFRKRRFKDYYKKTFSLNKKVFKKYLIHFLSTSFFKKLSYMLSNDLSVIFPFKKFTFNYFLVKKRFFTSSLISSYIVSSLLNRFKLANVLKNLKNDMKFFKKKESFIIDCSGRFDRKQRASNYAINSGKVSPATFENKISYTKNEVILKYGICGIKVWVLR